MTTKQNLHNGRHTSYTKFIILYLDRSGSNLLHTLLDSHPAIMSMGEVLRPSIPLRKATCGYDLFSHNGGTAKAMELRSKDPVAFLKRYIYQPHLSEVTAVGFKAWIPNGYVMEYIRGLRDLKVVRLRRRNYLRMLVSLMIAGNSGIFTSIDSEEAYRAGDKSIMLEREACIKWFNIWDRWQRLTKKMFSEHEELEVFYEDLTVRRDMTIKSVLDFLRAPYHRLTSYLKKQNPEPISTLIKNYDELKTQFGDTRWSNFFTD
jgi:hypothetical protein